MIITLHIAPMKREQLYLCSIMTVYLILAAPHALTEPAAYQCMLFSLVLQCRRRLLVLNLHVKTERNNEFILITSIVVVNKACCTIKTHHWATLCNWVTLNLINMTDKWRLFESFPHGMGHCSNLTFHWYNVEGLASFRKKGSSQVTDFSS